MKKNVQRFESITSLRAIACICIVCYHFYCLFIDDAGLSRELEPWYPYAKYFFEYSKNAVEMFFLISGFLTAWNYREKTQTLSLGSYFKRHCGKLIGASAVVNLWAWGNIALMNNIGIQAAQTPVTPLRLLLSVLMVNTGWFTSYSQTALPINTTMWYIDLLLLCYLLYFAVRKIGKNRIVYLCLCAGMLVLGWICLEHTPKQPFLWSFNGRAYAPFFLSVLLCEFQASASDAVKRYVTWVWSGFVAVFFVIHMILGFERVFGPFGTIKYVRYFEFVAAPGILLAALNLRPIRAMLSCRPLCWIGGLSAAVYYVHNNVMQDYWIINKLTGEHIDLLSPVAFLLIVASMIPFALLYQAIEGQLRKSLRKESITR